MTRIRALATSQTHLWRRRGEREDNPSSLIRAGCTSRVGGDETFATSGPEQRANARSPGKPRVVGAAANPGGESETALAERSCLSAVTSTDARDRRRRASMNM